MPVKVTSDSQLLEDIKHYKSLVKKLDKVKDLPSEQIKSAKGRRQSKSKQGKKSKSINTSIKRNPTSKKTKPTSPLEQKIQALSEMKQKVLSRKPSFMGRGSLLGSTTAQSKATLQFRSNLINKHNKHNKVSGNLTKSADVFGPVGKIASHARSFEHNLQVNKDYDQLIELVRYNNDELDFGLSCGILPKNIEKEKLRFHVDFEADKVMPYQSASFIGGDIDSYFRKLGQTFTLPCVRDAPLV